MHSWKNVASARYFAKANGLAVAQQISDRKLGHDISNSAHSSLLSISFHRVWSRRLMRKLARHTAKVLICSLGRVDLLSDSNPS
jgi:hypothetical protein